MTLEAFLTRFDEVRQRGSRWIARCSAHDDTHPSLQITEGERGILLKCWSGCTLREICAALGIEPRELFFDAPDNPAARKEAARARAQRKRDHARQAHQMGTLIDALRAADDFVQSRRGLDISGWSHETLNQELDALANAYHLLEHEELYG